MSKFKDRLWRELVREHGAELAQMSRPPAKQARWVRPRLVVGSTVGLAGVATTIALALGAASSSPAFAVTRNHDGTVTVRIMRPAGIAGANAKLTQLGVRAMVVQVAAGCTVMPIGQVSPLGGKALVATPALARAKLLAQARISPRNIPRGRTLVIASWRAGRSVSVAPGYIARGAPPACLPPVTLGCRAAGPPPGGNSGNSANSGNSGNSGSSGSSGSSGATVTQIAAPVTPGNSGNSGNSGAPPAGTQSLRRKAITQVAVPCPSRRFPGLVHVTSGNSGSS